MTNITPRENSVWCPVCGLIIDQPARKPGQRCGSSSTGCVGRVMLIKLAKKAVWVKRPEWAGKDAI